MRFLFWGHSCWRGGFIRFVPLEDALISNGKLMHGVIAGGEEGRGGPMRTSSKFFLGDENFQEETMGSPLGITLERKKVLYRGSIGAPWKVQKITDFGSGGV